MTIAQVVAKLSAAQQQIAEAAALLGTMAGGPPPSYPAREAPPCMSACRNFVDRAIREGKLKMEDYEMTGIQQGAGQIFAPRMTQAAQDRLEADVRALLASDYGQEYLEDESNAAQMDRRYVFAFRGYWLVRKSHNPDDGYTVRTDSPGPLPT